jgi:hypothetical protein
MPSILLAGVKLGDLAFYFQRLGRLVQQRFISHWLMQTPSGCCLEVIAGMLSACGGSCVAETVRDSKREGLKKT